MNFSWLKTSGVWPSRRGSLQPGRKRGEERQAKAGEHRRERSERHALLVRPTRANIQSGYAILRSMPLAYLEYDPWQRDRGSLRVRIPPVRRASRSITRDTRSSSVPSLFIQKADRKRTIELYAIHATPIRDFFFVFALSVFCWTLFGAEIFLNIKSRLEVWVHIYICTPFAITIWINISVALWGSVVFLFVYRALFWCFVNIAVRFFGACLKMKDTFDSNHHFTSNFRRGWKSEEVSGKSGLYQMYKLMTFLLFVLFLLIYKNLLNPTYNAKIKSSKELVLRCDDYEYQSYYYILTFKNQFDHRDCKE